MNDAQLGEAIDRARELALSGGRHRPRRRGSCGTSGFVVHTLAFATFCFLRYGDDPLVALTEAISAGGDTDSIGAILGGWLGALHGEVGIARRPDRADSRRAVRTDAPAALAACLGQIREGRPCPVPRYSCTAALARNLALYPVILGHGFRRLVPF